MYKLYSPMILYIRVSSLAEAARPGSGPNRDTTSDSVMATGPGAPAFRRAASHHQNRRYAAALPGRAHLESESAGAAQT